MQLVTRHAASYSITSRCFTTTKLRHGFNNQMSPVAADWCLEDGGDSLGPFASFAGQLRLYWQTCRTSALLRVESLQNAQRIYYTV